VAPPGGPSTACPTAGAATAVVAQVAERPSLYLVLLLCNGALPPHALTALRRPTRRAKIAAAIAAGPIEPICRLRSPEGMARVAREAAAETAAEIASFPRGTGSPPEDILRCLRRPWWFQQRVVPAKQRSAHYLKAFAHLEPIPEVKAQKEAAAKASTRRRARLSCSDVTRGGAAGSTPAEYARKSPVRLGRVC
jgi:hypothetical protein